MVYGLEGVVAFSTAVRRDEALADAQAFIAAQTRWGADTLEATDTRIGPFSITFNLRFTTQAAQQSVFAHIDNLAKGQYAPEPGSWLAIHECTHDEGTPIDCVESLRKVW